MSNADNKRDALVRDLQMLLRDYRVFSTKELVRQITGILYVADSETASISLQLRQIAEVDRRLS